ncbi:MAG: hypothetical protein ACRDD7_08220, partial [Peptostreptococcaceae bacterium]
MNNNLKQKVNVANVIEGTLEERKMSKNEIYTRVSKYFTQGTGDEYVAYNTFTTKFTNNTFTASELLVIASILGINLNELVEIVTSDLERKGPIIQKEKVVTEDFSDYLLSNSQLISKKE